MKSWLLEGSSQMPIYTDMRLVFDSLGGRQLEYNWLITDIQYAAGGIRWGPANGTIAPYIEISNELSYPTDALDKRIALLKGQELNKIIYGNDIQFIWAVFSGIKNEFKIDVNDLSVEPYADGNPNFWIPEPQIQHPLAEIEIVCWDSTSTLFFSKDNEIGQRFKNYFTDARDLKEYNQEV